MEYSLILAKLWGWLLVILGISALVNRQMTTKMIEASKDEKFLWSTGFTTLILGLITVLLHNEWGFNWKTNITVLGYLSILKGALRFLLPHNVSTTLGKFNNPAMPFVALGLVVGYGGYLLVMGYSII